MSIKKGYTDGPEGQIHWRMVEPDGASDKSDLYCFSPAPFASIAYQTLLPHLAKGRRVIATDYPGQGGSDGGSPTPSIESYAASMLAVIKALSGDKKVSVLGFHSGCLVAAEVKLQAPDQVDDVILIDVPAFTPEKRADFLPVVGKPFTPTGDLETVTKAWDMAVTKRLDTQPIEHCYAMFADTVGNGPRMNATFHAAFTYDVEAKLGALPGTTTILATQSALLEPSRRAATLIPDCTLIERLDIQKSVLDANAETTAAAVREILN